MFPLRTSNIMYIVFSVCFFSKAVYCGSNKIQTNEICSNENEKNKQTNKHKKQRNLPNKTERIYPEVMPPRDNGYKKNLTTNRTLSYLESLYNELRLIASDIITISSELFLD